MKKLFCILLALSLLLCGCGGKQDEITEPTTETPTTETPTTEVPTTEEPTEEITEPPTEPEPEYYNPLTGEKQDVPADRRIFAVTINNIRPAVPHYGVSQADLYFEMFINDYATRGLALYSDIRQVSDIGSVRSQRYNFTDIAQGYDTVMVYCGGSTQVLNDLEKSGVDAIYAEIENGNYHYRDEVRHSSGYSREHCLFVKGPELVEYAESKGIAVTQDPDKTYGMTFGEVSSADAGEAASKVQIIFRLDGQEKITNMVYDETSGMYLYNQFGKDMHDPIYDQPETFRNVIVIKTNVTNKGAYHVANLVGEGKGYFACDGKIIPILWSRDSESDVFHFTLEDGTPLVQGVGNSYIAIVPLKSSVSW